MLIRILLALLFLPVWSPSDAAPLQLDSGETRVQLIELYTSQGCSSCPPADEWLSRLEQDPALWSQKIPVAFHVDYWDYIGWPDPFAQTDFSHRQRIHQIQGNTSGIYTPGFLIDGREWRGFFSGAALPPTAPDAGRLSVTIDKGHLSARFSDNTQKQRLHVAVVGMGLQTDVKRGENRGRQLINDFSVLHYENYTSSTGQWDETLTDVKLPQAQRYGIALWITPAASLIPLQATGSWVFPQQVIATP